MTLPYFTASSVKTICDCIDYASILDTKLDCSIMSVSTQIDSFLGQSIMKQTVVEDIQVIPNDIGGFHIQLPNRFINSITSIVITQSPHSVAITLQPEQYMVNKKDGYIDTGSGLCSCTRHFCEANGIFYMASVEYDYGFEPLPADFTKAFCQLLANDLKGGTTTNPIGSRLKRYKLLNEEVEYETNSTSTATYNSTGLNISDGWIESILSKYRLEIAMSGMAVG